jgi:hypothetical protein
MSHINENRGHAKDCNRKNEDNRLEFIAGPGLTRGYLCKSCKRVSLNTALNISGSEIRFVPIADILLIADALKRYDPDAEKVLSKTEDERRAYDHQRLREDLGKDDLDTLGEGLVNYEGSKNQ